ncbi:MAG TPA: polysaccharide deacetylase family protein [Polyangiaceae bacterium]|nr:polysaccharide deacetylase family protein [Polyangiaceae bacterium]
MRLARLLASAQRRVPDAKSGALVLGYHLVGSGIDSPIDISVDRFRYQLDVLERRFRLLPLAGALSAATTPSDGRAPAALTFDDAYANFAEIIWPILRERRIPAILYVPIGFIRGDAPAPIRGTQLRPCSWAQLRELAGQGLEIGSHGVDHLNLRRASSANLTRELTESRETLERELKVKVQSFCYPQSKYDSRSARAVARYYDNAVVAGGQRYTGGDRYRVPRFPVRRDEPEFEAFVGSRLWLREAIASRVRQWRK